MLELEITSHGAEDVPAMREELLEVYADSRADVIDQPFYTVERYAERLDNYLAGPSFDLVVGRVDGKIVGYAFGSHLPADTRWWEGFEALNEEPGFTHETGQRTYAFREIMVRRDCQRRGYGKLLHDALLADRTEERAALGVRGDNPARLLYLKWGWRRVGYSQPFADSPRFEEMVLELRER